MLRLIDYARTRSVFYTSKIYDYFGGKSINFNSAKFTSALQGKFNNFQPNLFEEPSIGSREWAINAPIIQIGNIRYRAEP